MKKNKIFNLFLMFLPLIITIIALFFLPDQIPAHYGFDNQVDRWGSKYESLILPCFTILMGLFMIVMGKVAKKEEQNIERIMAVIATILLLVFNAVTFFFLYTSFQKIENLSMSSINIEQLMYFILGISMIVMGIIMPKVNRNSIVGLRTPWSMKNSQTWHKSQLFGGITFIIGGILIIVICIFIKNSTIYVLALLVLILLMDTVASYLISRKSKDA